ncbi:hypothetical protein, partial [Escherichia coli]|uniref:hypothetical protein n=1 Tax=Escherichia coli TaxID=562 RepID=UPI001BAE79FA
SSGTPKTANPQKTASGYGPVLKHLTTSAVYSPKVTPQETTNLQSLRSPFRQMCHDVSQPMCDSLT